MLLKRLTFLLSLILITTACKANLAEVVEHGKTVVEIYDQTEPLREEIATKMAPTPTLNSLPPIQTYFYLASSPNCEMIDDGNLSTLRSIQCREEEATVRYDEWLLEATANDTLDSLLNSPDNQVIFEGTWSDGTDPEAKLGRYLQYMNTDGKAFIFWTVYGKNLSGWAFRADGDQEALYQWWKNSGSSHPSG